MKTFDDNIDSSLNKLRSIFLQGFKVVKSSQLLSDKKELINEITNEILKQIEEYLVDINNVTIDLVCGRIENKINNFDIYDISLDDESLNEIKKCIDENINIINNKEEIKIYEKIEKTEIIEKQNNSYISPGLLIALTLSIIGFQEKLDLLSGFFDENKKSTSSTYKKKKKKKDESILSRLSGIFSFPLMILGRYKAPKWLTSDLVAPMFFDILENKIATNIEQNILKTVNIAKNAILHNRHLLASFDAERKLNESLISHNKKLKNKNRLLALDIITTKLKDVLVNIKDNTLNTFKNLKDTLIVFKDIVFTIIDMILFIANIALRIISLLFTYLLNIAIFSFTCILNLSILLFYLILVTATFIFAALFVIGIILLAGIIVTALFLAALVIISIVSLAIIAIIVILGSIVITTIFILTIIAIITILLITFLLTNLLLITTMVFSSILVVLADIIVATAVLFANIILIFATAILSLITLITIPFGFILATTITIFTFFATLLVTTLFTYSLLMLKISFVVLSAAFLTISMVYSIALGALAFSMVLVALAIVSLGSSINLTALLAFIILFGILSIILYYITKLVRMLLDFLNIEFDEQKNIFKDVVENIIDPIIDYILKSLKKFLDNEESTKSLENLKSKIDEWIKSSSDPNTFKEKILLDIRDKINVILEKCYEYIKDKLDVKDNNINSYISNIITGTLAEMFNLNMKLFMHKLILMIKVYNLPDDKKRNIAYKIIGWNRTEYYKRKPVYDSLSMDFGSGLAYNGFGTIDLTTPSVIPVAYTLEYNLLDEDNYDLVDKIVNAVYYAKAFNFIFDKNIPDDISIIPVALAFINPELLRSLDNGEEKIIPEEFYKLDEDYKIIDIEELNKKLNESFNEFDNIFNKKAKESELLLLDINNKKSLSEKIISRITIKIKNLRINTIVLNTNQNDTNLALNG